MRHDADLRFSLDGAWLAEQYLRTRSAAAQREFLDAVRAGRISIPAQYVNLMAGGASLETLVRSLYAGRALNRNAGRHSDVANITDVPAYPWAYASVLAAVRSKVFRRRGERRPRPAASLRALADALALLVAGSGRRESADGVHAPVFEPLVRLRPAAGARPAAAKACPHFFRPSNRLATCPTPC